MANLALRWSPENLRKAKKRLGVTAFRPGQEELIETVMKGEDALGILPTGGGKSLCYQLPALFLAHSVVVVSPLISLMKDQQDKLEDRSIPVAKLDSTLSAHDERETVDEIWQGEPELIYVTPERLERKETLAMLQRTGVSLLVVDEAHCISQWGHDFRPAYLSIREAVRRLGNRRSWRSPRRLLRTSRAISCDNWTSRRPQSSISETIATISSTRFAARSMKTRRIVV